MKNLFFLTVAIFLFFGCGETSNNKLDSDDYNSKEERIEKLKVEIKSFSDFQDAEFELFNVNGFHNDRTSIPGASSLDYKFVVKIDSSNISKWTCKMKEVQLKDYNYSWTTEIVKNRKQNWRFKSKPQFFKREGVNTIVIVYKNEGILFKRIIIE